MSSVVDASVVLTWLQDEPGADAAEPHLMEGVIGAANWSEVLRKVRQADGQVETTARLLHSFGLRVADMTEAGSASSLCSAAISAIRRARSTSCWVTHWMTCSVPSLSR